MGRGEVGNPTEFLKRRFFCGNLKKIPISRLLRFGALVFTSPPRIGFLCESLSLHDMARIFGIEIPNEKRIEASLPYIYGVGRNTASKILEQAGVDPDLRTGELSEDQLVKIAQVIQTEQIIIEGDLRREKQAALKRLSSINCNRGLRHRRGMPVRGQRTKTNARTRKGKKRTVGAKK